MLKYIFTFSHQTETTHWDHPDMVALFKKLTDFNTIRFSAYRTAMKLREVQKTLACKYSIYKFVCLKDDFYFYVNFIMPFINGCLIILTVQYLNLNVAIEAFDAHGLRGQNDKLLDVSDMVTVLSSLYETISAAHPTAVNVPRCLDLTLNWMLNVYDW